MRRYICAFVLLMAFASAQEVFRNSIMIDPTLFARPTATRFPTSDIGKSRLNDVKFDCTYRPSLNDDKDLLIKLDL